MTTHSCTHIVTFAFALASPAADEVAAAVILNTISMKTHAPLADARDDTTAAAAAAAAAER